MARISVRVGERTFLVHLMTDDRISVRLIERGQELRLCTSRVVGDTLESAPDWLPPKLQRKLLATVRAAAATRRPSGTRPVVGAPKAQSGTDG